MYLFPLTRLAVDAARRAGRIIRQPLGQAPVGHDKISTEIATKADLASEQTFLDAIRQALQPAADTIIATNTGIHDELPALRAVEGPL